MDFFNEKLFQFFVKSQKWSNMVELGEFLFEY